MAYKKKEPGANYSLANLRQAAMETINVQQKQTIDYGSKHVGPITALSLKADLLAHVNNVNAYNQLLQQADQVLNNILEGEKKFGKVCSSILKSAYLQFGEDSSEIEMLGGTRLSEKKKRVIKPKPTP